MTYRDLATGWGTLAGLVLLAAGIFGFFPNPVIGEPGRLFATDGPFNAAHAVLGVAALVAAWNPNAPRRGAGVALLGLALIALLSFELASPALGGLLRDPVNVPVRAATLVLGVSSWFLGLLAHPARDRRERDRREPAERASGGDATQPARGGAAD